MLKKIQEAFQKLSTFYPGHTTYENQLVSFIEKWIENAFFDFDAALVAHLSSWIDEINFSGSYKLRMKTALQKALIGDVYGLQHVIPTDYKFYVQENIFYTDFDLFDLDIEELSRQLTYYSGKYFYRIKPKELLDCAWMKPSLQYRSPNCLQIMRHFNQLSCYVQHSILYAPTLRDRLNRLKTFVRLADSLWKRRNFTDGLAIVLSFDGNCLFRLKAHLEVLGKEEVEPIETISHEARNENNYKELLSIYENAINLGEGIPFLGVFLNHLTFFYDGNPDFLEGLVNFDKCAGVHRLIRKTLNLQKVRFQYLPIHQIQEKIYNIPLYDDDMLYDQSLIIEPPGTTAEQLQKQLNISK